MTQLPHRSRSDSDEDLGHAQKMGRIHLDLIGPLAVMSANGGYQYFQSGIEVSTRVSFVSLLKKKSEALEVTRELAQMLEVKSDLPLKSIRTDMGGEYDSHEWTKFAKSKGFKHELTSPYSQS